MKIKLKEKDYTKEKVKARYSLVIFQQLLTIELIKRIFLSKKFLLVIDEAHNIKKIGGLWSRSILELRYLSKYKIILTGTPMPQDFKDFYNYFDFLYPNDEIINPRKKAEIEVFIENKNFDQAADLINQRFILFTQGLQKNS